MKKGGKNSANFCVLFEFSTSTFKRWPLAFFRQSFLAQCNAIHDRIFKIWIGWKDKTIYFSKECLSENDLSTYKQEVGSKDVPQHKSSTYVDRNLMSCLEKLKLKLCFKEWCRAINSFCMLRFVQWRHRNLQGGILYFS